MTFTVEGSAAGTTTTGSDGTFAGDVQLPDAPIGPHVITVSCGGRSAAVPIDLVVAASTSTPGAGATAAAVLVFFVLLGSVLFGRAQNRRTPTPKPETEG